MVPDKAGTVSEAQRRCLLRAGYFMTTNGRNHLDNRESPAIVQGSGQALSLAERGYNGLVARAQAVPRLKPGPYQAGGSVQRALVMLVGMP